MAKKQKLRRAAIPELLSKNIKLGREGQIFRSWSVTPGDFFRIYIDEPLQLEVNFRNDHSEPRVILYTDICGRENEWREIEFEKLTSSNFRISVKPEKCGIFQFKIKHSPDNGKNWFWDRVPFTKLIVDPAESKDIRLYTMIPTASGSIAQWKEELKHIKSLGCNMVHLLPITAMDESESPYAAADLFDVDHSFADKGDKRSSIEQFEEFVMTARDMGMRLCVDLVLNHIGINSSVAKLKPEWLVPDKNEKDSLMRAGCWHMNKWIKWEDLVKINYDHPEAEVKKELWEYMQQYAFFWANYAAYTGGMVRFDNLHSSHTGFIYNLIKILRTKYPSLVIQAEFFSDSNTLLKTASECELNLLLANPWEHPFAEDLRDYILYLHEISPKLLFLNPLTTHDTGAPAQLYGSGSATVPRYFALALMGTGQTGIVQGTEHEITQKIEFIGRNRTASYGQMNKYTEAIGKINTLHEQHSLFHQGGNIRFIDNRHGAVLACIRDDKFGKERFILVANMDTTGHHQLTLDVSNLAIFGNEVKLEEIFTKEVSVLRDDKLNIFIEPCGIRAYRIS